jgi:phage head maturation protease
VAFRLTISHKSFGDIEMKAGDRGEFSAVFSTFDVKDADGDVVRPGAIPDGAEVPIVIAHNWQSLPVGKGIIRSNKTNAVIDGEFFLDTTHGRDAFTTVKRMGKTQQYSWGFEVTGESYGEFEGAKNVRFIESTRPFEVSPVLVGSNPITGTLSIKGACPVCGSSEASREEKLNGVASGDEEAAVDPLVAAMTDAETRLVDAMLRQLLVMEG